MARESGSNGNVQGRAAGPRFLYLVAALQWGIIAPLNFVKVLQNVTSPIAHYNVPKESEECQRDCAIARMWATLFWGSQVAMAGGFAYVFASDREVGTLLFVLVAAAQKVVVGALLLKAFADGVVKEPVAIGGALDLVMAAVLFGVHLYRVGMKALREAAAQIWFPAMVGILQA